MKHNKRLELCPDIPAVCLTAFLFPPQKKKGSFRHRWHVFLWAPEKKGFCRWGCRFFSLGNPGNPYLTKMSKVLRSLLCFLGAGAYRFYCKRRVAGRNRMEWGGVLAVDDALWGGFVFQLPVTGRLCLLRLLPRPPACQGLLVTRISYPAILDGLTSWLQLCGG